MIEAVLLGLGLAGAALLALLWATGRFARLRRGRPSQGLALGTGGAFDSLTQPSARLITDGREALALRLALAGGAARSLDLMYYQWEDDLCGRLLTRALLEAADRGVRVRLLLDDVHLLGRDRSYRALDRHPRIEVRIFNPVRSRANALLRGIEIVLGFLPYNRRMHGKLWLTDGRLALTGGRNVGDAYFGAASGGQADYDDLDILVSGPVAGDFSALYDRFWNADSALPLRSLWPGRPARLARFRARLQRRLGEPSAAARLATLDLPGAARPVADGLLPAPALRMVADPPDKALGRGREGWLPQALVPLMRSARRDLCILTPYCVPGRQGMEEMLALRRRGVSVRIVTNSLAANDNPFVHGAWAWYRARLLAAGVEVVEAGPDPHTGTGATRRMLHGKALLVDGSEAFVGSFNFDMRSAFLNTELGVITGDPALVSAVSAEIALAGERGWQVSLQAGRLVWRAGEQRCDHEPGTLPGQRMLSWLTGHLPIHRFL